MDLLLQNIVPVTGLIAFFLGILSFQHNKLFKISLLLALPAAYAAAKILPQFFYIAKASEVGGWLTFYTRIYENTDDVTRMAIHIAPLLFIAGRLMAFLYRTYFYKEKVETAVERKHRVRAYYGVGEFD